MTRVLAIAAITALACALACALGCSSGSDVSRTLGARCDSAGECDDRCLPDGTAFPGGFCSLSCEGNDDCPDDARCADVEAGVCLFECADDAQCAFLGEGWRCRELALREDGARKAKVCLGG
jgi:hypothetical protein